MSPLATRRTVLLAGTALTLASGRSRGAEGGFEGRASSPVRSAVPGDDPAALLGAKLLAWFDSSDPGTLFADLDGRVPARPGDPVALQRAKGGAALTRAQPDPAKRGRFDPAGYNQGAAGGLVLFDGAWYRSDGGIPVDPEHLPGFILAFQVDRRSADGHLFQVWRRDRGTEYVFGVYRIDPGHFIFGANYAGAPLAQPGQEPPAALNAPVRLYGEYDGQAFRFYIGTSSGPPRLLSTIVTPRDPNPYADLVSYWADGSSNGGSALGGADQHWMWLDGPLTDGERARVDAWLLAAQGQAVVRPALKDVTTTGTMAEGSPALAVADATGFAVGDHVLVEIGGEAGEGRYGTTGVGGIWPAREAADEATILAMTTVPDGGYIRARDTGKVYKRKPDGSGYYAWDPNLYYSRYANPLSLGGRILSIAGTVLTLDRAAAAATTGAAVSVDNAPVLNAITGPDDLVVDLTGCTGLFRITAPWQVVGRKGWRIRGAGPDRTVLRIPKGARPCGIDVRECRDILIEDLGIHGNHAYTGMGLDYAGPNDFNGYGHGVNVGLSSDVTLRRIHGRDTPLNFIVFQYAGGTLNLADHCRLDFGVPTQHYVNWQFESANNGVPVEFRDCVFESEKIQAAFEAFQSTGTRFTRCVSRNGLMAMNSAEGSLVEACRFTIEADSRDTRVLSPSHPANSIINLNNNVNTSQARPPAAGGALVDVTIDIQGFWDAEGNVPRAVSVGQSDWVLRGTYDPAVADDGSRKGFIRAPVPKPGAGLYAAPGPQIAVDGQRTRISGLRLVPYTVAGSGRAHRAAAILVYDPGRAGTTITNTITGTARPDVTNLPGNAGNLGNDAYAAR